MKNEKPNNDCLSVPKDAPQKVKSDFYHRLRLDMIESKYLQQLEVTFSPSVIDYDKRPAVNIVTQSIQCTVSQRDYWHYRLQQVYPIL
jgi:hypothetical protein